MSNGLLDSEPVKAHRRETQVALMLARNAMTAALTLAMLRPADPWWRAVLTVVAAVAATRGIEWLLRRIASNAP